MIADNDAIIPPRTSDAADGIEGILCGVAVTIAIEVEVIGAPVTYGMVVFIIVLDGVVVLVAFNVNVLVLSVVVTTGTLVLVDESGSLVVVFDFVFVVLCFVVVSVMLFGPTVGPRGDIVSGIEGMI